MGVGGPGVDFASLLVDFGAQNRLPARKMRDRGALPWLGRACTPPQPRQRVARGAGTLGKRRKCAVAVAVHISVVSRTTKPG